MVFGRDFAAVAQEATPTGERPGDLSGESLFRQVSAPLAAKAKEVALDINVDNVAFSVLGKDLVVLAPAVRSVRGFTTPGPLALAYFSLSAIDCGAVVSGYYTLELVQQEDLAPLDQLYPGTAEVAVNIVNLNGKVVAERPFIREVMRMKAGEAPELPPTVGVEIRESATRMGALEVIAKTHDHDSRSGWDWWIWTFGGT
jgi:hypothetical protein